MSGTHASKPERPWSGKHTSKSERPGTLGAMSGKPVFGAAASAPYP
jgi:hypothetical protein